MRDAHGYVEGLTKKRVDSYIEEIDPAVIRGDEGDQEDEETMLMELEKIWGRVIIDMGGMWIESYSGRARCRRAQRCLFT